MKNHIIAGIAFAVLALISFAIMLGNPAGGGTLAGYTTEVYYSNTCGCCVNYLGYLRGTGLAVQPKSTLESEVNRMKDSFNIPGNLRSCHTAKIGGYFVEGHVPIGAIQKLLAEKPDIDGIALAGMPSGSPGMPGYKTERWEIYAVKDGMTQGVFYSE